MRIDRSSRRLTVTATGIGAFLLLAAAVCVLVLMSGPSSLPREDAERLVRQYLRHQASEQFIARARQGEAGGAASREFLAQMTMIEQMQFESVQVGRLLPDYLLSEWGPTYYAKVVIREGGGPQRTEYYNLGSGALVTGRTSRWVWLFVL